MLLANMPPSPRLFSRPQIFVRIVRHGIHGGPPTTLEYSFGTTSSSSSSDTQLVQRKLCQHSSKDRDTCFQSVRLSRWVTHVYSYRHEIYQEKLDDGRLDKGTSRGATIMLVAEPRSDLVDLQSMRQIGNIRSNETYNPDEVRNPPPTNMIDAERDSDLEKFIRGR